MKLFSKLLLLLFICIPILAEESVDYTDVIQPCVAAWHNECIDKLSPQEIMIIADMLLLSYQVVQASIIMSQARLMIQSELLQIVTLSINDTFDVRIQAQNNDLTAIKQAVSDIEQAQETMKSACNSLKGFAPLIIKIDPTVIQKFIASFKEVILHWVKSQHETIGELEQFQQELGKTTDLLDQVNAIFQTIIATNPIDHSQLLEGTNSLTNMYNAIENTLGNLTKIRQKSLTNFSTIVSLYFKGHYQILYNHLQSFAAADLKFVTLQSSRLPNPVTIFA
jgi:hypothetical protein